MSIKKNEDGTYEVVLGIAEGTNESGMTFSRVMVEREIKRINEDPKPLITELGYPDFSDPALSNWEIHARLLDLHHDRACGYISDLKIVEGNPPKIIGTFTPAGKYEREAIAKIDAKEPIRFGMRAQGFRGTRGDQPLMIEQIVTWDLIASK